MRYAFFTVLPDPPGIPVADRPYQDVLRELPKKIIPCSALRRFMHEFILSREFNGKN
jgi:hypothetical protein